MPGTKKPIYVSKLHSKKTKGKVVVNTGPEIRKVVIARGVQFTNKDFKKRAQNAQKQLAKWQHEHQQQKAAGNQQKARQAEQKVDRWQQLLNLFKYIFPIPNADGKLVPNPHLLKAKKGLKLVDRGQGTQFRWEYFNKKQNVKYRIGIIETKKEFKTWLNTSDNHVLVIYEGHSRYGRGACFGDTSSPGNRWGDGSGCATGALSDKDGLFRFGFEIVGVPVSDLCHHEYHTEPIQGPLPKTLDKYHTDKGGKDTARHHKSRNTIFPVKIDTSLFLSPSTKNTINQAIEDWGEWKWDAASKSIKMRPIDVNKFKSYFYKGKLKGDLWGYRIYNSRKKIFQLFILLKAGWKDTNAKPWEIDKVWGATNCKVFCHFGCSSFKHFHTIIRSKAYKNWKKSGKGRLQDKFAFFTTGVTTSITTPIWLYWLLKCPKPSKGKSWEPCLNWATQKAKHELRHIWKIRHYTFK